MAIGIPQDPVQAVHQLLALLEYPELDDYDRSLLGWQREQILRVKANPSPQTWLQWYRDALGAMRQLQGKWQAQRAPAPPPSQPNALLAPTSAARIKEAHSNFVARWNVRLQDQALVVKNRVSEQALKVPVSDVMSQTHLQFTIRSEDLTAFCSYVHHVLNDWGADVASKLTPSWHDHLKQVVTAESTPAVTMRPPQWPSLNFALAATSTAHPEHHAVRRPTLLQAITRAFQNFRSISSLLGISLLLGGSGGGCSKLLKLENETAAMLGILGALVGVVIGMPFAIWLGSRSLKDEIHQSRVDQTHRMRASLQAWATQAVENQRTRIQALLAGSTAEAKARLSDWVDQAWEAKPTPFAVQSAPVKGPDYGPLLLTLNSARGALATRVAQLELELGVPVGAADSPRPQA